MVFKVLLTILLISSSILSLNAKEKMKTIVCPLSNAPEVTLDETIPNQIFYKERLEYKISWGVMKVGKSFLQIDKAVLIGGNTAYHILSRARSAGIAKTFYRVRDINESWPDVNFNRSYGYLKKLQEGNYFYNEWLVFDYKKMAYYGEKLNKKNIIRKIGEKLLRDVHDVLSSLYYFRTMKLEPGKDMLVNMNTKKDWQLTLRVLKRKKIKTPFGKRKCILVEPGVGNEGIFVPKKGKKMYVWLTDDEERIPVMLIAEIFIGSIKAKLVKRKYE
ncbi:MAG: DUF3108 domain-containing protein [Elusimicrobiales bacterium]|nr:DUF3108 domain-containing protein [Elusimicrobiales bacterium]